MIFQFQNSLSISTSNILNLHQSHLSKCRGHRSELVEPAVPEVAEWICHGEHGNSLVSHGLGGGEVSHQEVDHRTSGSLDTQHEHEGSHKCEELPDTDRMLTSTYKKQKQLI